METDSITEGLKNIIKYKKINTFFQPIISLKTGKILGYEALTRGPEGSELENPIDLFSAAKKNNMLFQLERVSREQALYRARNLGNKYKLFINVDPNVIYDDNFRGGTTKKILDNLPLSQNNIVIELTERSSIKDYKGFRMTLNHYKKQGYSIAIDDTGAGYSGLQSIVSITYNFIKIDRSLINNIDKDPVKRSLLDAFVKFAKKIDSKIIAEGIETKTELDTLIELGVDYGQGYLIARPNKEFVDNIIMADYIKKKNYNNKNSNLSKFPVGDIAIRDKVVTPSTRTDKIVEIFKRNENLQSIVVIEDDIPVGLIMRDKLYYRLGTKYGYAVFMDRPVELVMDEDPMIVKSKAPISEVSKMAMERPLASVYDSIIVIKDNKYFGTVTIKSLLDRFSELQVEEAKKLNPLTNLPGNPVIEEEITERLKSGKLFSVLYIDLDNFKIYNDHYGYKKGDQVLEFTAGILKDVVKKYNDFVGHIGGDDFIVVTSPEREVEISQKIIERFDKDILQFFNLEDRRVGGIRAKNRLGKDCLNPITSISIAIVNNINRSLKNHLQISDIATELKKYAKNTPGSIYIKEKRKRANSIS